MENSTSENGWKWSSEKKCVVGKLVWGIITQNQKTGEKYVNGKLEWKILTRKPDEKHERQWNIL